MATTPAYVVRRVGSEYVLVRVDVPGMMYQLCSAVAGIGLIGFMARRHGLLAGLSGLAGMALVYYGITGRSAAELVRGNGARGPVEGRPEDSPSLHHPQPPPLPRQGRVQVPADPLDEALMESFPASDPPATRTERAKPPESATGGGAGDTTGGGESSSTGTTSAA